MQIDRLDSQVFLTCGGDVVYVQDDTNLIERLHECLAPNWFFYAAGVSNPGMLCLTPFGFNQTCQRTQTGADNVCWQVAFQYN
jgi:hypothetical protein